MAKKNLDPKTEVTANLDGLTKPQFVVKAGGIAQAAIDNSTIAPTSLDPAPAVLKAEVQNMSTLMVTKENILQQLKQNTGLINKSERKIKDYIIDGWLPEVQKYVTDPEDIKLLGLGIKNVDDGHSDSLATILNSRPENSDFEYRHLEHILTFRNSLTGLIALPDDVKDMDVYEYIGTTAPTSLKQMTYLGRASRGKFTVHFTEDQVGLTVWYVAVYIGKKSADAESSELSGKVRANVV
jgi:hypothetical protein